MEVIKVKYQDIPNLNNVTTLLGYFDALHLGHLSLINKAKELNLPIVLLTFNISPKEFFTKKKEYVINTFLDKEEILTKLGIDYLVEIEVDEEFFSLSPKDFINKVIIKLGSKNVICGFDYYFGKDKVGNKDTLIELSNNLYKVYSINPVTNLEGKKISTSLIKSLIELGNIKEANTYLSRPFRIRSKVVHGNHLGNTIGFATANLDNDECYIYPKSGVYAGICKVDNKYYKAMINVGTHPTIKELKKKIIEANILDFNQDIYDKYIEVYFISFIRDEIKFDSFNLLKEELIKNRLEVESTIDLEKIIQLIKK